MGNGASFTQVIDHGFDTASWLFLAPNPADHDCCEVCRLQQTNSGKSVALVPERLA